MEPLLRCLLLLVLMLSFESAAFIAFNTLISERGIASMSFSSSTFNSEMTSFVHMILRVCQVLQNKQFKFEISIFEYNLEEPVNHQNAEHRVANSIRLMRDL